MRSSDNTGIFSFTRIYIKSIIFIFFTLLVVTGCGTNDADFASSKGEEPSSGRKSRDINVRIVVDAKQTGHRRDQPSPFPGGRSSSSGSSPGGSSSGGSSPGGSSTDTDSPSSHSGDGSYKQGEGKKAPLKKIDILFYLAHKEDGMCWSSLVRSIDNSGFFAYIEGFDWQAATAFYSHNPALYRFRKSWGSQLGVGGNFFGFGAEPVYVLKKNLFSTNESDKYLRYTISTEYERNIHEHYEVEGGARKWPGEPQFPWPHRPRKIASDPLFGLKRLLKENPKTFVRKKSKTFIILFELDRYHYTSEEWKKFTEKYADTYFITLAARRGMVSNLPHNSQDLKWLICGYTHIAQQLAKYIRDAATK